MRGIMGLIWAVACIVIICVIVFQVIQDKPDYKFITQLFGGLTLGILTFLGLAQDER